MAEDLTFPQTAGALKDLGSAFESFANAIATVKVSDSLSIDNVIKLNVIAGAILDKFIEQVLPNINFNKDEPPVEPTP